MRPGEAVMKLTALGYRLEVEGDKVRWRWGGPGSPDPDMARPLLQMVIDYKDEVHYFLRSYCPRCGGVLFVGDLCFLCDWHPQAVAQKMGQGDETAQARCGECAHFNHSPVNPAHGFGCCALAHLSKRAGAYPGKQSCSQFEPKHIGGGDG